MMVELIFLVKIIAADILFRFAFVHMRRWFVALPTSCIVRLLTGLHHDGDHIDLHLFHLGCCGASCSLWHCKEMGWGLDCL